MNEHPTLPTAACAMFAPLVPLAARHLVPEDDRAAWEAHLASCAFCQAELAAYQREDAALREMVTAPATPPPFARGDIERMLHLTQRASSMPPGRHMSPPPTRGVRPPAVAFVGALLALVVVVACVALAHMPHLTSPATTTAYTPFNSTYTYQVPTKTGGTVTIGDVERPASANALSAELDPTRANADMANAVWQGCVVQLPDLTLGNQGWKPGVCATVPSTANGYESADGLTTRVRIDSQARWSDGQPVTAADFLFAWHLLRDPAIGGTYFAAWPNMRVQIVDSQTLLIHWGAPNSYYLASLWLPEPLHAFAVGPYAGVYAPRGDHYDSALAQRLVRDPRFTQHPIGDGPFQVQSFAPDGSQVVLTPNRHFFSNFFHAPVLDQVIFQAAPDVATLLHTYKAGQLNQAAGFEMSDLPLLPGIPADERVISPGGTVLTVAFNQRANAPAASTNGGVSLFAGPHGLAVRQAFIQGFDLCAAFQTVVHDSNCRDPAIWVPSLFAVGTAGFNPTLPTSVYNPTAAAQALSSAGYPLVNGVRMQADGRTPLHLHLALPCAVTTDTQGFAEALAQDWAKNLGVYVTIVAPGCTTAGLPAGAFDLALVPVQGMLPQLAAYLATGGVHNIAGMSDPAVDTLLHAIQQTGGNNFYSPLFVQLQTALANDAAYLPLIAEPNISLAEATLGNYSVNLTQAGDTWNISDWFMSR